LEARRGVAYDVGGGEVGECKGKGAEGGEEEDVERRLDVRGDRTDGSGGGSGFGADGAVVG
jgi:hypothetical protein